MAANKLVLGKSIERVITLERQSDGSFSRTVDYDARVAELNRPRKRQTGLLRPIEKRTRKNMVRGLDMMHSYLLLHERSNRRKKNGWARDLMKNLGRAIREDRP